MSDRSEAFHIPLPTTPAQQAITMRVAPVVLGAYMITVAFFVPAVGTFDAVHDFAAFLSGCAAFYSAIKPFQLKSRLLFVTFGWSAAIGRLIYILLGSDYGIPQKWLVLSISAMFLTLSTVYVMAADYITIVGTDNDGRN